MSSSQDKANKTLDALVEEAYQHALAKGTAITDPDKWRRWKRRVYVDTAKREGAGYLASHYQRLGLGTAYLEQARCWACDQIVVTPTSREDDDNIYCSYECAGERVMTFSEFMATLSDDKRATVERMLKPNQETSR